MLRPVLTADELQALSGAIQSEYKRQEDGTYLLDVATEGGYELSDVEPLRNALGHKKGELDTLREKRDALQAKLDAAQEELTTLRSDKGGEKLSEMVEAQVNDIRTKLEGDVAELQNQLDLKDGLVKKHVLEATAAAAIAGAGGNVDVLMPHVLKRLKVEEKDGQLTVVPLQADGGLFMSRKSGATEAGTLEELVSGSDFKTSSAFSMCFKADKPDGGVGTNPGSGKGAGGDNNGSSGDNNSSDQTMTPQQRLTAYRKNNQGPGRRTVDNAGAGQ